MPSARIHASNSVRRLSAARPPGRLSDRSEPFRNAEQAWFWTMGALAARRDGGGGGALRIARPCDPDDVVKCLDQLYRHHRIDLLHARILRHWGERQMAPDPACASETHDARLWREALDRLDPPLRSKGILAAHAG